MRYDAGLQGSTVWAPDLTDVVEEPPIRAYLDEDVSYLLILRCSGQRVVDFALMVMMVAGDEEVQIARIDCRHGEVHEHQHYLHGTSTRRVFMPITKPEDVDAGYDLAVDRVLDGWHEFKRRWTNGR